ncbi:transglycosylase domain-containing protein [Timonella sp. A28]|uniref:transglycosylase domain-containing protein n=1 Tax=Timonella sp. A28 TaxID=3442640 RepID=UPI003EBDB994
MHHSRHSISPFQLAGLLVVFLVLSVVGGILAAAMIVPVAAGTSAATKTATETFYDIPDILEIDTPSQASKIYASDGKTLLATYYAENRLVVPLDQISLPMQNAAVATEDKRFWSHGGVDLQGIARAALENAQGNRQGGSTLTQQYVKNVLIHKAARAGDYAGVEAARAGELDRKLREAKLAINVEKTLSKEEILANYLNIAQFGIDVYGVEAAANYYFSKSAKDLSIVEAATIAGITQRPGDFDPSKNPEENQRRRNTVLGLMYQQGYINQAEYDEAVATKVEDTLKIQKFTNGCEGAGRNGFFCDYVTKTIIKDPAFGETTEDRKELLYRGGLEIITTLDVKAQKKAYQTLQANVPAKNEKMIATALTAVEPGTGEIKVMTQNRKYNPSSEKKKGYTSVNYSASGPMGGSQGFQVGSTFKTFVLAEWLKEGHTLNETVSADVKTWYQSEFNSSCASFVGTWKPGNVDGRAAGRKTALQATTASINTAFAAMGSQLDLCSLADTASDIGFKATSHSLANAKTNPVKADADGYYPTDPKPAMVLGTQNSTPLDMASAYATFAAGGVHCTPVAITKVKDRSGKEIKVPESTCKQTIDTATVNGVTYALSKVVAPGGGAARAALAGGRPSAGKTGTTQGNGDAWFIGYTPQLSTAVWMGYPESNNVKMQHITINGRYFPYMYGSSLAAPMWKEFMDYAHKGKEIKRFDSIGRAQLGQVERPREEPDSDKDEEEDERSDRSSRPSNNGNDNRTDGNENRGQNNSSNENNE